MGRNVAAAISLSMVTGASLWLFAGDSLSPRQARSFTHTRGIHFDHQRCKTVTRAIGSPPPTRSRNLCKRRTSFATPSARNWQDIWIGMGTRSQRLDGNCYRLKISQHGVRIHQIGRNCSNWQTMPTFNLTATQLWHSVTRPSSF